MFLGIHSSNDVIYFRANTVDKQGSATDATTGPSFSVYKTGGSTTLNTGTMSKVGSKTGHYVGSFTASDANYDAGQYFILVEATVDGQTPAAHINFQLVSDGISLEETFQDVQAIAGSTSGVGSGSISIDHNFGATDNYRITGNGTPLADVVIRAFARTDYNAGQRANSYVVGQTKTKTDGRWQSVIRLDTGSYTLEFSKKGAFRTQIANITV